jgi:hypothetical protein
MSLPPPTSLIFACVRAGVEIRLHRFFDIAHMPVADRSGHSLGMAIWVKTDFLIAHFVSGIIRLGEVRLDTKQLRVQRRRFRDISDRSTSTPEQRPGRCSTPTSGPSPEFERDVMRERTVAGLAAAKGRGERLGRRPAALAHTSARSDIMPDRGECVSHVARALRVGRSTIYRAIDAGP